MSLDWVMDNLSGIVAVITLLTTLAIILIATKFVRRGEFNDAISRISTHERQIAEMQQNLKTVATHKDINALSREITTVSGDVKSVATAVDGLSTAMRGVQNSISLVTKSLISKGDK